MRARDRRLNHSRVRAAWRSDPALLSFARSEGRVLMTADADHLRLAAAGAPHAGILFVPPDAGTGMLIGGAMLIAEVLTGSRCSIALSSCRSATDDQIATVPVCVPVLLGEP